MKARVIAATAMLLVACGAAPGRDSARAQSTQQFNSLDQLLAPIALYPDQLLAQILMSASESGEGRRARRVVVEKPEPERQRASGCRSESRVRTELCRVGALSAGRLENGV